MKKNDDLYLNGEIKASVGLFLGKNMKETMMIKTVMIKAKIK